MSVSYGPIAEEKETPVRNFCSKTLPTGVIFLFVLSLGSAPAEATDGLCWRLCDVALTNCYIEADCWTQVCKNGGGLCHGGCECVTVPCYNEECSQAYDECKFRCSDWPWHVSLSTVTTLEIPDLVRQDLEIQLEGLRLEIEAAVQAIADTLETRLGQYRAQVEAMRDSQVLDPDTAAGLIDLANGVEASLGPDAMVSYISETPPS